MKSFPLCLAGIALAGLSFAQEPAAAPATAPAGTAKKPAAAAAPKAPAKLNVSVTMRDGLRFDPPRMNANPGDEITVTLENADSTHQVHNFLVLQPGKLKEVVAAAMELGEKGPAQNFVPAGPDVIVHSAVLDLEKTAVIKFTMPAAPGIYPYVCTFPGHGMVMYGAIYSGVKAPPIDKDPNLPPTAAASMIAGGGRRPFVQRMFMPDAGPAAIAIALPGMQNVCWDAGQCRLRYAWHGGFIDASAYWKGNGRELAKLSAEPWWNAPLEDFPLRFDTADSAAPAPAFLGYKLEAGLPEFHYKAGTQEVFEKILPGPDHDSVAIHFRIPKAAGPVFYRAAPSPKVKWSSSAGEWKDNLLSLSGAQAADFTLTLTSSH